MPFLLRMLIFIAVMAAIVGLIEWLAYSILQRKWGEHSNWLYLKRGWWIVVCCVWVGFIFSMFMWPVWRVTHPRLLSLLSILFFVVFMPKLVMAGFEILEWMRTGLQWSAAKSVGSTRPISRKTFLTDVGLAASALTFSGFLYGVTWGKYAYRTERIQVPIAGLDPAWEGLKIVQISDAHLGSFIDTPRPVLAALKSISELNPDLILFTGDLVNSHADEAEPWIPAFAQLSARLGKYAVLGNHDYADYGVNEEWEREASRKRLAEIHEEMGFRLLRNEHVKMVRGTSELVLIGVENWGRGFRKSGDLLKAMKGSGCETRTTVLMSHDPTHWEQQVMGNRAPIELTLSGHTHGMQFGLEIPWLGVKWSPSQWRYRRWAGLYQEGQQFLHINRGFGVLGFQGRVGMPPEITVLELTRA